MIFKTTIHSGYSQTAGHFLKMDDNEKIIELGTKNLISDNWKDASREMHALGLLSNNINYSMAHTSINSSPGEPQLSQKEFEYVIKLWDEEFNTFNQPNALIGHVKKNRSHIHRMLSLVNEDGTNIRMDNYMARQEKVARIAEFDLGHQFTVGRFNQNVIKHLRKEGRDDVAEAMTKAGLHQAIRSSSIMKHKEWQQEIRTGIKLTDVRSRILTAWKNSYSGTDLQNRLAETGLTLVQGHKTVGVLDNSGSFHGLLRSLNAGSKQQGIPMNLKKADIDTLLARITLPDATNIKTSHQQTKTKNSTSFTQISKHSKKKHATIQKSEQAPNIPKLQITPKLKKPEEGDHGAGAKRTKDAADEEKMRDAEDKIDAEANAIKNNVVKQNQTDQKNHDAAGKYENNKKEAAAQYEENKQKLKK